MKTEDLFMNKHTLAGLPRRIGRDILRIKFPLILTAVYVSAASLLTEEICPLRILTGFPCPGCGLTRAGVLVLTGHWNNAAQMNLMIFLWIPAFIFLFLGYYLFPGKQKYAVAFLIVTCILTLTYYTVRMALYFPEPPLTYRADNLLTFFMGSISR